MAEMTKAATMRGTIKRVLEEEGYGFVSHTATGTDYFFHRSMLEIPSDLGWSRALEELPVEFEGIEGPKGPRCLAVRVLP